MEIAIVALLVIVLIFLVVLISRKPSKASEQDLFRLIF